MLAEVRVENLGLLKNAHLQLDSGLNVITGETGAGKTLCVEALSYLCGARAPRDAVGPWGEAATIEARFVSGDRSRCKPTAAEFEERASGADLETAGEIVVRRVIDAGGKSRQYLNGRMATVSEIEDALASAIQIYGQFSVQALAEPRRQIALLDAYVGAALSKDLKAYIASYEKAKTVQRRLDEMRDPREIAREIDFLRYQISEISAARLRPGEDEELSVELRRLEGAEQLRDAAAGACELLDAAEDSMRRAAYSGPDTGLDSELDALRERCSVVAEEIQDLRRAFRSYFEAVEADDVRLAEVRERLDVIGDLKRKYGRTTADILEFCARAQSRLEELEGAESRSRELDLELEEVKSHLEALGARISAKRRKGAKGLERSVQELLPRLGMTGATFAVDVVSEEPSWPGSCGPLGCDSVTFFFSSAKGVPARALNKVASGGELARLMLAIEVGIGGKEGADTLVFDEVDQGVGGAAAVAVGELLASVSEARQVICVTHLAQVASYGDVHIVVEKGSEGASTRRLDPSERVREISRMLSGVSTSWAANKHAAEILERAAARKAS